MENYVVYKITCITDENIFYIGSTNNLQKRIVNHKARYNNPHDICYNLPIYKHIRANGGWDNFNHDIIDNINGTREEILQLERYYITTLNPVMNVVTRTYITREEKKEYQKDYHKEYRGINKERLSNYLKEYNKINITCECGCEIKKKHLPRHKQSQKHIRLMNELT
jgi:hypothetical protein